jgi:hypothetical protein
MVQLVPGEHPTKQGHGKAWQELVNIMLPNIMHIF